MRLKNYLLRKLESFSIKLRRTVLYDNLHILPKAKWDELRSTGNVALLIKKGVATEETLVQLWEDLQNEYLHRYGLSKDFEKYLKFKVRYLQLCCDFLIKNDVNIRQKIEIMELDLVKMEKDMKDHMTDSEIYGWLIGAINTYLPLNTIGVIEYHDILNQAIDRNKQQQSYGKEVHA